MSNDGKERLIRELRKIRKWHRQLGYTTDGVRIKAIDETIEILIQQQSEIDEKDIVNRYTVLFHDASSAMEEFLIRKLIREIQGKRNNA